jgi:hypothetical protein
MYIGVYFNFFYRPLYLPLHVLLSFDSVSLSTNLVTGAPVLVLKLVVDGTYLSLANQQLRHRGAAKGGGGPGSMHHVCVLEMEWFELTLRLCDNSQFGGDYQKVCVCVRKVKNWIVTNVYIIQTLVVIHHASYRGLQVTCQRLIAWLSICGGHHHGNASLKAAPNLIKHLVIRLGDHNYKPGFSYSLFLFDK